MNAKYLMHNVQYIESLLEGKGFTLGKERTFLAVCNQTTTVDRELITLMHLKNVTCLCAGKLICL